MMKINKGKSSAIFKTLRSVCGDKKVGQEQISMIEVTVNNAMVTVSNQLLS